ncbi:MAG TPA: hypothetical protein PLU67_08230 [Candidatus Kapabacteria bacterium]|nr:hypothetical protein [Candidatus Kapabacteria bacterium]
MNPIKFIAKHFDKSVLPEPIQINSICAFTGEKITEGYEINKIISSSFTDYEYLKYKSDYVSVDIALLLSNRLINGNSGLRNYSFYCTEKELKILKREEIEDILINPKETPFIFCISFNNKKHISFKSKINYNNDNFIIQTDLAPVKINMKELNEVYPILKNRYSVLPEKKESTQLPTYFSKEEIEFGCTNYKKIESYGAEKYFKEENILNKYRKSYFLKLLIFILRKNINN